MFFTTKMKGAVFLLLAFMLASLEVYAISVASDYLVNGTMEVIEGASKIYGIRLQNPTEYEVGIKLDYDKTFMKIVDYNDLYTLSPKETGFSILFNVTAPKKPGIYEVSYTVSEAEPGGGGGLPIRLKINRNFKLRVIEDSNKFHFSHYASLAYIAVLLTIGFAAIKKFLFDKKKSRKSKKNRKVNK